MQNEKSLPRNTQRSTDVGLIDSPARPAEPAPPHVDSIDNLDELRSKLKQAEHLSAQSFVILRRQSAMIRKFKADEDVLTAANKELSASIDKLTAENGELSMSIGRITADEAAKAKQLCAVIEKQNVMIARLLNLPPTVADAA